jgi:helix-turn-helix protein
VAVTYRDEVRIGIQKAPRCTAADKGPCLGRGEAATLSALLDHANNQTGVCWPSRKLLAEKRKVQLRQINRDLASLERKGFIARWLEKRPGQSRAITHFQLLIPEALRASDNEDEGHSRPPSEEGHSRPPSEEGHSRPPSEEGHSRPPSEEGHSRPPSEEGHFAADGSSMTESRDIGDTDEGHLRQAGGTLATDPAPAELEGEPKRDLTEPVVDAEKQLPLVTSEGDERQAAGSTNNSNGSQAADLSELIQLGPKSRVRVLRLICATAGMSWPPDRPVVVRLVDDHPEDLERVVRAAVDAGQLEWVMPD